MILNQEKCMQTLLNRESKYRNSCNVSLDDLFSSKSPSFRTPKTLSLNSDCTSSPPPSSTSTSSSSPSSSIFIP
ncbi:hypothetical protein Fmac_024420 [Flemingia macrophylla]|uniref:Uncharacterized protein n=1 Tax=Flemingia macrophylla TaxID=520843 RepID=A0ABD1LPB4_9FABA